MTMYLSNNQQTNLPSNVAPANPQHKPQDPKKVLVLKALRAITGIKDVLPEKCIKVYEVVEKYDLDTCKEILDRGVSNYDDSYNKYPSVSFWKYTINDFMRERRIKTGDTVMSKYSKADKEEQENVRNSARELAEYFAKLSNKDVEKPKNMFEMKVERYKNNAKAGNILITEGALDGTWMNREEAEASNLEYTCPIEWLASKDKSGKSVGNIGKILGSV